MPGYIEIQEKLQKDKSQSEQKESDATSQEEKENNNVLKDNWVMIAAKKLYRKYSSVIKTLNEQKIIWRYLISKYDCRGE